VWKADYKSIIVQPGVITKIIHNEPEKMNALTIDFEEEFPDALRQAREDPEVKVVTFTATGPYFCAGDDVRSTARIVGHKLPYYEEDWRRYVDFHRHNYMYPFWDFPKPIVCGVQGGASGGGTELAAMCDITVVAENAVFSYEIFRWGTAGANALIYTAGWKKAAEIYLTGWNFDAQEALRLGLATKVVPPDKVEEEVMRYANILALLPLESLVLQKLLLRFAVNGMGARQTMFYGWECSIMAQTSKSGQESGDELAKYGAKHGIRAALEKSDEPFIKYGYKRFSTKSKK
jgi:enoyl-CoA hydratase/carnithine racemase